MTIHHKTRGQMKDKKVQEIIAESTPTAAVPLQVQMSERLTDADKTLLDMAKVKRELGIEKAKSALAQSEAAELSYNNTILQLAIKYHLIDGDVIADDGTIKRKSR